VSPKKVRHPRDRRRQNVPQAADFEPPSLRIATRSFERSSIFHLLVARLHAGPTVGLSNARSVPERRERRLPPSRCVPKSSTAEKSLRSSAHSVVGMFSRRHARPISDTIDQAVPIQLQRGNGAVKKGPVDERRVAPASARNISPRRHRGSNEVGLLCVQMTAKCGFFFFRHPFS
jgi:hypothetical protein